MKARIFTRSPAAPRRLVAIVLVLVFALLSPIALPSRAQSPGDLKLSITPSKTTVNVGDYISVAVRIENVGAEAFPHLYVWLNTPDAINPVAVSCPGASGGINACDIGELGPGSLTEILFIVQPLYKSPNGPLTAFVVNGETFVDIAQVSAPLLTILGPPEIGYDPGPLATNIKRSSAVIVWTTDDPSSSVVRYGVTDGYGETRSKPRFVTNHQIRLTGLRPGTTYHFQVESTDRDGTTTWYDQTFTTAP